MRAIAALANFAGHLAAAQALVVAVVILWAGLWKATFPRAHALARRSALARILHGEQRAMLAHVALGACEMTVAILLLALPQARTVAVALATLLTLGFVGYLILAWRIDPKAPCACMGGRATTISWNSLLRAGALLVMSLAGWPVHEFWGAALQAAPLVIPVLALEVVLLWALSPEFGGPGIAVVPQAQRMLRLRLDPTCARARQDVAAIERALQHAEAYRGLRPALGARTDAWREGCWDYIAYSAFYERQAATVVFTAPVFFDPAEVSAAVVSDADNSVLLSALSRSRRRAARLASAAAALTPGA
jgi:hypothetical protein